MEIVKIDLGNNSAIHYCYHPVKDEYILAVATASHIIKTRDITVTMLLAFATQSANTASKTLKNDTKEAVTEEAIKNQNPQLQTIHRSHRNNHDTSRTSSTTRCHYQGG